MRTPALALAATLAFAALACPALADTPPSVWDEARDPSVSEHWALHLRVQHLLSAPHDEESGSRLDRDHDAELHAEAALAMLEDAGASDSPDVQLRFDLGMVQYELAHLSERTDLYEKASRTLEGGLAMGPDAPGSTAAMDELASCYAKLARTRDELDAWRRYIPRILDPRDRAVDLMNMAEAEMRLGHVDDALTTLRDVLRQCAQLPNTSATYVLTLWDVAVALDRSGDARGALQTAGEAATQSAVASGGYITNGRGLLKHEEGVYFVPAYERDWYLALGSEAIAKQDKDPREAAAYLVEALHEWDDYIEQATATGVGVSAPAGARQPEDAGRTAAASFLRIARMRRERVSAELTAAAKHLKGERLRSPPDAE